MNKVSFFFEKFKPLKRYFFEQNENLRKKVTIGPVIALVWRNDVHSSELLECSSVSG